MLQRPLESALAAAIGVVYESGPGLSVRQCHCERVLGQLSDQSLAHRPPNDQTRVEIKDHGEIEPALRSPQWSERPGVVALSPSLSSPNRTCTSQRIRLSIQALRNAKATSA